MNNTEAPKTAFLTLVMNDVTYRVIPIISQKSSIWQKWNGREWERVSHQRTIEQLRELFKKMHEND